jgi:DNA-binding IscR family transcriptional regulator
LTSDTDRGAIADDVRRFILTSIPSIPFMEAMLLFKALPGRAVETRSIAERLYIGEKQAAQLVDQLREANVVSPVDGAASTHRYAPPDELASILDRVAHAYVDNLIGVTRLIHSRTERMAHQFADAFKIRKD